MVNLRVFIAVFLGFFIVSTSAYGALITNLSYYKMDKAGDEPDFYGLANLSAIGSIKNDSGMIGRARNFTNGTTTILQVNTTLFNWGNSKNFTVSAWVKPNETDGANRVWGNGLFPGTNSFLGVGTAWGGGIKWNWGSGNNTGAGETNFAFDTTNLTTRFNHVLMVKNESNKIHLYYNNVLVGTLTSSYDWTPANGLTYIGARRSAAPTISEPFDGLIDEVGIWTERALTGAEIAQVYNCGLTLTPLNLCEVVSTVNITIYHPFNNSQTLDNSEQFNFTCDKSGTVRQYLNGVLNYSNTSYINNTLISRTLNLSFGNYNTTFECINDSNQANVTIFFTLVQQLLNQTQVTYTLEQNRTPFFFEVQSINTISNVSAFLVYNGVSYVPTFEQDTHEGAHFHFNYTKIVPFVAANNTLIPFYWNYTIYYTNGSNFSNVTGSLNQTVKTIDFTFAYSNYTSYGVNNYTRNLSYSFTPSCSYSFNITAIINNNITRSNVIMCGATNTNRYIHNVEGAYNISVLVVSENNKTINNAAFISDLVNPTISLLNYSVTTGFVAPNITVNLICNDSIMPFLYYNLSVNQVSLYYVNLSTYTLLTNKTGMVNGANNVSGFCSDTFGSSSDTLISNIYFNTISLIDEKNNTPLNLNNFTSVRLYYDDNSTYFDFKTEAVTVVNFTQTNNTKLRLELVYPDTSVITRYLDTSLLPISEQNIKLCGNPYGTTHYEQLFTSTTEKAAFVKNAYSDCYILADKTRFAYQNTLVVKGFTISALYYLYIFNDENQQTLLASLDGSIQTFINLDTLEFNKKGYNLAVNTDVITFDQFSNTSIRVYYLNQKEDNTALNVSIYRLDTGVNVFSSDTFTDPNEFTLYFDYSMLNVSNTTLFKIDVTKYKEDGTTTTISQYLNQKAGTGGLSNGVAALISFMLVIFGLSLASSKVTYSWFGVVVMVIAIAVLVFAVGGVWWITFLQAIYLIILIFIIILMANQNYNTVA